jgi:hypothetical protein
MLIIKDLARILLLCAAVLSSSAKQVEFTWTDCGSPTCHTVVNSVDVVPNPPVLGIPCNVTGHALVDEPVTDGQITVAAKFSGLPVPVSPSQFSVCGVTVVKLPLNLGTITVHGLDCPTKAGNISLSEIINIPTIAPLGTYDAKVSAIDQNGEELLCLAAVIKIKAES